MSGAGDSGYAGQMGLTDTVGEFNTTNFLIRQFLGRVVTSTLVQVKAVNNNGGVVPVGLLNVQPLVNQLDGQGNATPHGIVTNLPYLRLQGGANAIILDPQVGDIGLAIFADRDISAVKATRVRANPGSRRRFDWADGLYLGGFLNGAPTQYVRFNADGISIIDRSANQIVMAAAGVTINGVLFNRSANVSGIKDLTTTGNTSLGGGAKKVALNGDAVAGGVVVASSSTVKAT